MSMTTRIRRRKGKYRRHQFMASIEFAEAPKFYMAPLAVQAAWYRLNVYCAGLVNGGCLLDCGAWEDRQWLIEVKITKTDVDAVVAAGLAAWCGTDLELDGYDHDGDKLWRIESDGGHKGNAIKRAKKREAAILRTSETVADTVSDSVSESASESDADGESPPETLPDAHPISETAARPDSLPVTQPVTVTVIDPVTGSVSGSVTEAATATAYASAFAEDSPSGVSSTQAREAPKTPPAVINPGGGGSKPVWFPRLQAAMADTGFRTEPVAVREMGSYLRDEVQATSLAEALAFMFWIRDVARRRGEPMEFSRHAGHAAARDWRENHQDRWRSEMADRNLTSDEAAQAVVRESQRPERRKSSARGGAS